MDFEKKLCDIIKDTNESVVVGIKLDQMRDLSPDLGIKETQPP